MDETDPRNYQIRKAIKIAKQKGYRSFFERLAEKVDDLSVYDDVAFVLCNLESFLEDTELNKPTIKEEKVRNAKRECLYREFFALERGQKPDYSRVPANLNYVWGYISHEDIVKKYDGPNYEARIVEVSDRCDVFPEASSEDHKVWYVEYDQAPWILSDKHPNFEKINRVKVYGIPEDTTIQGKEGSMVIEGERCQVVTPDLTKGGALSSVGFRIIRNLTEDDQVDKKLAS